MKVLHMITSLNRGGIEVWLMNMLKAIKRDECQMDFCCKGEKLGEMAQEAIKMGAKVYHVPLTLSHIGYIKGVTKILNEGNYDIIHNHLEAFSWIPVLIAKRNSTQVITSFHNTRFAPQTSWIKYPIIREIRSIYSHFSVEYALKYSDIVTGCSEAVLRALDVEKKRKGLKNHVLYYGIDFTGWPTVKERIEIRRKYGIAKDEKIVIHVGRFAEQKNHKGLIDIFFLIKKEIPKCKLLLIGDGPLKPKIENYVKKKRLQENVVFMGIRDDVREILAASDIFLFPSLHEGLPVASIEASGVGLPVVGSRIPGMTEVIKDNENGFLFEINEKEKMALASIRLLKNTELARRVGNNGIEWARRQLSLSASRDRLIEIYNECMDFMDKK